jgi:acetyl esterase/lipase
MNALVIMARAVLVFLLLSTQLLAIAGAQERIGRTKPPPDLADVSYGSHKRNVLDLWKAKSQKPTPLVVFIHGGGFHSGSKDALPPALLEGLLARGISVMAINYRLSPEVSFPAHYMDCARAIQLARSKAKQWNLDPDRIGATGGSAGAGTSLWIGFHDDMADSDNVDPVLQQSTRLSCIAVLGAQSTYDPRLIRKWVSDSAARHPALEGFYGLKSDELDTPKAYKLYETASPINHLTKDDPPVYAFYSEARELPADAKPGQGIHHINFGLRLKEQMDKLGIQCIVRHRDEGADAEKEIIEFFGKHLGAARASEVRWPPAEVGRVNMGNPASPPLDRSVSLIANGMPLRDAYAALGRQAGVPLALDEKALVDAGLDLDAPVTISINQESLGEAVGGLIQLMNKGRFTGAFREIHGGTLVISTIVARQEHIKQQLPVWLKPFYNRGLLADVDDAGNVVSITAGGVVTDELLAQLATLPRLRQLEFGSTKDLTEAGLAHLAKLSELEKLGLSYINQGRGLGDEAIRAITGLKGLRDLSLRECGTTDAGVRMLEGMQQLARLELRQEGRLTDAALVSVGKLTGLKHLDLSSYVATEGYGWMRFSAEGIRHLAGLRELEELHLVGHAVPSDALVFDRLTSLSLGGPSVDDACAARIASCRDLRSLTLVYTDISDAGMQHLAALAELTRLQLDSRVVTDDGIAYLKALKKLSHVNLRATQVTHESLAHLAEIKTLTRLDLHGSGHPGSVTGTLFSIEQVKRLKELPKLRTLWLTNLRAGGYIGLKELTQLRELSLTMCDITSVEVGDLEVALPNTKIHAISGGSLIRPRK